VDLVKHNPLQKNKVKLLQIKEDLVKNLRNQENQRNLRNQRNPRNQESQEEIDSLMIFDILINYLS